MYYGYMDYQTLLKFRYRYVYKRVNKIKVSMGAKTAKKCIVVVGIRLIMKLKN